MDIVIVRLVMAQESIPNLVIAVEEMANVIQIAQNVAVQERFKQFV